MFKQVKSALFWYYLYKFRKRVIMITFLLLVALFANTIYADVVEYLKLKDRLEFLELALLTKWCVIITNMILCVYLVLTIFKKENVEKNNSKKENNVKSKTENIEKPQKQKKSKHNFTKREEEFLKRDKLRSKADMLLGD